MAWVIDASSVVDLLSGGRPGVATEEIVGVDRLHAPDVVTGEVVSALARRARAGHPGADDAVREFGSMPLALHPSHPLVRAAWSRRDNLRITDAFYIELARELSVPLVTSDARLARAVEQQSLCDVRLVGRE